MTSIEHANITVPDIDAAIKFLMLVAPDFVIRSDEMPAQSYRWVHIGNDQVYFALQESELGAIPKNRRTPYKNYGVNHIGLIVSDIHEIENKLIAGGYKKSIDTPQEKFRERIYYFDEAGFEWELTQYLSENPSERYLYE